MSKRPAKKESTEENKEETPPKFIIIELKKSDVLGEIAINLEDYFITKLLTNDEEIDKADGFGARMKEIFEGIIEDSKEKLEA